MRCPDVVMSAMSHHPGHSRGKLARAYWSFTAGWQHADGGLHRLGGQWHLTELASRFRFRSVRTILTRCLPLAARAQRRGGGFQDDCLADSACLVLLAYSRHDMLNQLRAALRVDPLPLVHAQDTPLAIKTRREALAAPRADDDRLAARLIESLQAQQRDDGSWDGLIQGTVQGIDDLLDCGAEPRHPAIQKACRWLLAQQRPAAPHLFPNTPPLELTGLFYTDHPEREIAFEATRHPEYRIQPGQSCFALFPLHQTGAALSALCRCGLFDVPEVRQGFRDLFRLRGPGHRYYTDHWCACNVARWVRTGAKGFGP
jgi:hypothetical protein